MLDDPWIVNLLAHAWIRQHCVCVRWNLWTQQEYLFGAHAITFSFPEKSADTLKAWCSCLDLKLTYSRLEVVSPTYPLSTPSHTPPPLLFLSLSLFVFLFLVTRLLHWTKWPNLSKWKAGVLVDSPRLVYGLVERKGQWRSPLPCMDVWLCSLDIEIAVRLTEL